MALGLKSMSPSWMFRRAIVGMLSLKVRTRRGKTVRGWALLCKAMQGIVDAPR